MLRYEEGVLPSTGQRIEAAIDLDELALAHGFCQTAPGYASCRRLSCSDVAVSSFRYVDEIVRRVPHLSTFVPNILQL